MEWKNIYRGFLMGISDLIPGVSGGTTAHILGIYERLLQAIGGFFSREWKKYIGFLLPLALGIAVTLFVFSRIVDFLLKDYAIPTHFFFLGVLIGVVPYMSKKADIRKNFKLGHFFLLFAVAAMLVLLAIYNPLDTSTITSLTLKSTVGLFLAGWAASMAALLPGMSGSLLFLLVGVYGTAIHAISTLNLSIIIVIGAGVIVGCLVSTKAISYLSSKFTHSISAVIIGMILGSLFIIYPGLPESGTPFVMSVIALVTGLLVANIFNAASSTTK